MAPLAFLAPAGLAFPVLLRTIVACIIPPLTSLDGCIIIPTSCLIKRKGQMSPLVRRKGCIMPGMAKPFVSQSKKTSTLKGGAKRVYRSWALRVTFYDRKLQAVKQKHLRGLGTKATMTEIEAREVVAEFGGEFGFTLEDLRTAKRLKIVTDNESDDPGAEKNGRKRRMRNSR